MWATMIKNSLAQILELEGEKEVAKNPKSVKGITEETIAQAISAIDITNFSKGTLSNTAHAFRVAADALEKEAALITETKDGTKKPNL